MSLAQRAAPALPPAARAPYRAAVAALALVAADVAVDPARTHIPLCPFHAVTGLWCPLCGGLRCVYSLAHADVATALRDNALLVLSLPALLVLWLEWVWRARHGSPSRRMPRAATVSLVVVVVMFTVLRNLPFATALRP